MKSFFKLVVCLLTIGFINLEMQPAISAVTNIIGPGLLNGDFNADTGTGERFFSDTPNWENIGTGLQTTRATRDSSPLFDGTRNVIGDDDLGRIFGMDTGFTITDGDIFNTSYVWRDGNNWNDALDQVGVSLFTTDDDTIGGLRNTLIQDLSGFSTVNNGWEIVDRTGFYTAGAPDDGKRLFVELNGVDGNPAGAQGIYRLDNFVLSVGAPDPPPGPQPPSALTGFNLFSDTFDRSNTSGLDLDSSVAGMSSSAFTPQIGTTYNEFDSTGGSGVDANINNNKMELAVGSGQSYAGINHNFVDSEILTDGGFAIEFIVDPKTGSNGDTTDRYAAVGVGLNLNDSSVSTGLNDGLLAPNPTAENDDVQIIEQSALAFVIFDDGTYNFFDSFAETDGIGQSDPAPADSNSDIFGSGEYDGESVDGKQDFLSQVGQVIDDEYKVRLEYEVADFNQGSTVTLTAYIQDVQVDLDTSNGIEVNPEDRDTYTFTWDGNNQNYIAFEGRAQTSSSIDFLMIETLASGFAPEDLNMDGFVDSLDLGILLGNWGLSTTPDQGEINATPPIDGLDLGILLAAWNPPPAVATAAVPEPQSLILFLGATTFVFASRKRS